MDNGGQLFRFLENLASRSYCCLATLFWWFLGQLNSFTDLTQQRSSSRGFTLWCCSCCPNLSSDSRWGVSIHTKRSLGDHPELVGGWPTPLQNMSSSVGMMNFPIYGKRKKNVPNHQPVKLPGLKCFLFHKTSGLSCRRHVKTWKAFQKHWSIEKSWETSGQWCWGLPGW